MSSVACPAEDLRASSDSGGHANLAWFRDRRATHMDLLPGATWAVLEHSLTKRTWINVSDSEGCSDLSGPVLAMRNISPQDQKCPVLIIARALQRRGWTPVYREVTHARGGPLEFSTSKWSSRRPYLQCLLRHDHLWEMGIDPFWSGETASLLALLLRGKIVAPKHGAAVYSSMSRDVGADDSLPVLGPSAPANGRCRQRCGSALL